MRAQIALILLSFFSHNDLINLNDIILILISSSITFLNVIKFFGAFK